MLSTSLKPPARKLLATREIQPPPRAPSIASNMACRHSIEYGDTTNQPQTLRGTVVEIDPESFLQLFFPSAANSLTKGLTPKTKKKHQNSNKWYSHQDPSKVQSEQKNMDFRFQLMISSEISAINQLTLRFPAWDDVGIWRETSAIWTPKVDGMPCLL